MGDQSVIVIRDDDGHSAFSLVDTKDAGKAIIALMVRELLAHPPEQAFVGEPTSAALSRLSYNSECLERMLGAIAIYDINQLDDCMALATEEWEQLRGGYGESIEAFPCERLDDVPSIEDSLKVLGGIKEDIEKAMKNLSGQSDGSGI